MDLRVCDRWRVPVDESQRTDGTPWFADWARREPEQVGRHLVAGLMAYSSLQMVYGPGELRSAHEYFGGLGAQSLMIQDGIRPERHIVLERSPEAVRHLRSLLADRRAQVCPMDSYKPAAVAPADLAGLDFGDLTAHRLRKGEAQRELLDRVMATGPKAVVLTDVAGPRLHLHRERYAEALQCRPDRLRTYPGYLSALADWLRAHYGYAVVRGYYHRWSAVLALVPTSAWPSNDPVLLSVPAEPKGLTVHD